MSPVRKRHLLAALSLLPLTAAVVHAEGGTLMPGGARAVARAGATVAAPSDAMTLINNPAGLALLRDHQAYYGVDVAIDAFCVQPYGYYGWGVYLHWRQLHRQGL